MIPELPITCKIDKAQTQFPCFIFLQSLSHCELITDERIRQFGGSPCAIDHIKELELGNCPLITDNALDYLIWVPLLISRLQNFRAGTRLQDILSSPLSLSFFFVSSYPLVWPCLLHEDLRDKRNLSNLPFCSQCLAGVAVCRTWASVSHQSINQSI